ncbi:MAG TPA: hypothetical protein VE961_18705 [Pyrinomonadaceae bacterium]|nr:hypothetical protein [Pyrinomonadaceae bacterium]
MKQCVPKPTLTSAGLLAIAGSLLALSINIAGQTLPPSRPVSDFNIQILNLMPNKFVAPVQAEGQHGAVYGNSRLRLTPDWKPSAEVPAAASVIKVEFWLEQGSIRLEVQAYLGEMAPNSRPPDWEKMPKLKIASRLLHVDETVTVDETRQVGIEPFQVKVARAEPWSVGPPEIINQTQALNVEGTTEERPFYIVTVRNVSPKNIIAIEWRGTENDRMFGGGAQRGERLIPAGKLYQIHEHFATVEEKRNGETTPELASRRQIVITAILFEDGSFEGNADAAAGMAAQSLGESMEFARRIPLLEATAAEPDQTAALAKLKAVIEASGEPPDPALISNLLTRFPGVSDETRLRKLLVALNAGMKFAQVNLRTDIQRFEYQQTHSAAPRDLKTWLTEMIARYKKIRSPYLALQILKS